MPIPWRRVLIDWPARAVELWFAAYRILIVLMTIATVSLVLLVLVLALFGVRWGW